MYILMFFMLPIGFIKRIVCADQAQNHTDLIKMSDFCLVLFRFILLLWFGFLITLYKYPTFPTFF